MVHIDDMDVIVLSSEADQASAPSMSSIKKKAKVEEDINDGYDSDTDLRRQQRLGKSSTQFTTQLPTSASSRHKTTSSTSRTSTSDPSSKKRKATADTLQNTHGRARLSESRITSLVRCEWPASCSISKTQAQQRIRHLQSVPALAKYGRLARSISFPATLLGQLQKGWAPKRNLAALYPDFFHAKGILKSKINYSIDPERVLGVPRLFWRALDIEAALIGDDDVDELMQEWDSKDAVRARRQKRRTRLPSTLTDEETLEMLRPGSTLRCESDDDDGDDGETDSDDEVLTTVGARKTTAATTTHPAAPEDETIRVAGPSTAATIAHPAAPKDETIRVAGPSATKDKLVSAAPKVSKQDLTASLKKEKLTIIRNALEVATRSLDMITNMGTGDDEDD